MTLPSFLALFFLNVSLAAQSQLFADSNTIIGTWVERQGRNEIESWIFHPNGNFTNVSPLSGDIPFLQGHIFKGKYTVDTIEMTISINYYEDINLRNNKIEKIDSGSYHEQLKILELDTERLRLMEIQFYNQASKEGKIDYTKWNTRLLFRPNKLRIPQ